MSATQRPPGTHFSLGVERSATSSGSGLPLVPFVDERSVRDGRWGSPWR
jgi:hypothetical protein